MDYEPRNKPKNNRVKRGLTTIGAGVLGSILTLGVIFNTDLLPEAASSPTGQETPLTKEVTTPLNSGAIDSLADMVEATSKAIVGVVNYKEMGNRFAEEIQSVENGTGSGVVYKIDADKAYIVTNNHVIEGAQKIDIALDDGKRVPADVIGYDALTDLAVLTIEANHVDTALKFGDSDALRAGEPVVAIGNPLGLDFSGTVTQGIVSAVNRSIQVDTSAGEWALNVIQTDAAINPGNSGGALLNEAGEVIGINSLKVATGGVEGIGFAIPSNDVIPLVEEMVENGHVERPYLGIGMASLNEVPGQYVQHLPESVEGGVIIASVDPNSAAHEAGIQPEDIITEINGEPVKDTMALRKALYTDLSLGDEATFTFYRGTEKQTVTITLTKKQ